MSWDEQKPEPKWESAVYLKGVDQFEVAGLDARQGLKDGKAAAIVLEDTADGVVRESRAAEGCGTFLEVRGERTRNVAVYNNDTSKAAKKHQLDRSSMPDRM